MGQAYEDYTQEQVQELFRCSKDPIYFMEQVLGFMLSREQELYVKAMLHDRKVLALMARQTGKTRLTLAFMYWKSQFQTCGKHLYIARNYAQATAATETWRQFYESTPPWMRADLKYYNRRQFEFDNSSMLVAAACGGTTGRGMALSTVALDDFDSWDRDQEEYILEVIYPCLRGTTAGLIIPSTLTSRAESAFKYLLNNKREEFAFIQVTRPAEEMRRMMGEETYRREHLCEYTVKPGRKILSSR